MTDAVESFRAFNRVHTRFAGVLKPRYMGSDLGVIEARLLYEIAQLQPVLASTLQAMLDLDAGYASRILRRFEQRGWIARGRGNDARERPIALTAAGAAAFAELDTATREGTARQLEPLGAAGRAALTQALDTARLLMAGDGVPWTLRTFRPGDMGAIAARQSILYNDGYGWGRGIEVLIGEIVTAFLRDFKPGREQCWVAERGGRMLGCVFLVEDAGVARLRLLYVEAEARGLGIGKALVDACVDFARDAGYSKIVLWTHTVLTSARKIYAGAGFRIVSVETHDEFGKPEQGETWELELAGPAIASATTAEDLVAVVGLFKAYEASLAIDLAYQDFAGELAGLPGAYAAPDGSLLLARGEDGTPLGCVALRPMDRPGRCEMKRLYVAPAARGTGLGRRLMEAVIAEARRIGYREICLDTLPDMAAAQGLYRAAGFVPITPYYDTPVVGTVFLGLSL